MSVHPLDDVRGLQEEGKTSAEWLLVAREHVQRTLLATGYFTADDLDPIGIPEPYRRSIHGSVTGYFSGHGYMVEAGRRKSERPERKGAKNTIFRITKKGREELSKLVGVGADARRLSLGTARVGIHSGENESVGVGAENPEGITPGHTGALDRPTSPSGEGAGSSLGVDPGGSNSGAGDPASQDPGGSSSARLSTSTGAPEPQQSLLPEPDPKAWAA